MTRSCSSLRAYDTYMYLKHIFVNCSNLSHLRHPVIDLSQALLFKMLANFKDSDAAVNSPLSNDYHSALGERSAMLHGTALPWRSDYTNRLVIAIGNITHHTLLLGEVNMIS